MGCVTRYLTQVRICSIVVSILCNEGSDHGLTPSELARGMRKIPSAKRDAAVKAAMDAGREKRNSARAAALKPCTCHVGTGEGKHRASCPVWQREYNREYQEKKRQAESKV